MALTKVKLIADGVITSANLDASHGITTSDIGEGSNLYYTDSRVSSYLSTNGFATQTDIVAAITDSAPVTLDTLNELAAALGDDPNFATTTATSLGLKAPLASPSFTGNATFAGNITVGTGGEIRTSDGYGIRLRNAANSANEGGFVRSGLWEGDSSRDPSLFAETGLGLRFYTGGSANERMRIDSSGLVTIGSSALMIDSGNTNFNLEMSDGIAFGGSAYTYANIFGSSGNIVIAANAYPAQTGSDSTITLRTASAGGGQLTPMVIKGANVGIGTSTPVAELNVNGRLVLDSGTQVNPTGVNAALVIDYQASSDVGRIRSRDWDGATWKNFTIEADDIYLIPDGNVGIGTTSPTTVLDVRGSGVALPATTGTTPSTGTRFRLASTGGASAVLDFGITTGGKSWLQVTDRTDLSIEYPFLINPNGGNVGIGTSSPDAQLEIEGTTEKTYLHVDGIAGNAGIASTQGAMVKFYNNGDGHTVKIQNNNSSRTDATVFSVWTQTNSRFLIRNDGNVGIGTTSPGAKLEVSGSLFFRDFVRGYVGSSTTQYVGATWLNASDGLFYVNSGGVHKVLLDSNGDSYLNGGNVGIGTTSPQSKLHVNGGGINLEQGGQLTERTTGIESSAAQNTWYTVHTFNQYELTLFFLLVGFEDDLGDGNNRTAVFVDSGSLSYGSGFAPTRLSGSTSIEAQRSGQALQIRFTHTAGGSNRQLRWSLITVTGN